MRQLLTFAARLSLVLSFSFALSLASGAPRFALAQGAAASTRRVVALREATLRSGVRGADFERYFADSVAGPMNRHIPGVRVYLMKGERGARVGGYVIVYEFDSLERRNEYAPKPDSASERLKQLSRALPPRAMENMAKYVDIAAYTDYVIVR